MALVVIAAKGVAGSIDSHLARHFKLAESFFVLARELRETTIGAKVGLLGGLVALQVVAASSLAAV